MKAKWFWICAIAVGVIAAPAALYAQTPVGTAVTYQGQLKQAGQPVNGTADFDFTLWDADVGGSQVGPLVPKPAWPVDNGLFTVPLDFGADVFTGEARWLEIVVNGTTLSPRQELTPAPYTLYSDATRGIHVDDQGNVGIGRTNPTYPLDVLGDASNNAIRASGSLFVGKGLAEAGTGLSVSRTTEGFPNVTSYRTEIDGNEVDAYGGRFGLGDATLSLNSSSTGDVLLVGAGGNVGIGTTRPPTARLEIGGTAGVDGLMFPDGTLQTTAAGGGGHWAATGDDIYNTNTGRVGIGTNTPLKELDVVGNIRATAGLTSGSALVSSSFGALVPGLMVRRRTQLVPSVIDVWTGIDANTINAYSRNGGYFGQSLRLNDDSDGDVLLAQGGGNVGIGTTNPDSNLEVSCANDAGGLRLSWGSQYSWLRSDIGYPEAGGLVINAQAGGGWARIDFQTDGVSRLLVKHDGNVGIGTTDPRWPLDIDGDRAVARLTTNNNTGGSVLELKSTTASPDRIGSINFNDATGNVPGRIEYRGTDEMRFRVNYGERMRIDSAGNVGIGTTNPARALQVGDAGIPDSEGMIRLASRSGTGGSQRRWDIGVPETDQDTSGPGYSFVIDDISAGTDPEFMVKFGSGNVGIGTITPEAKLDVKGNIIVRSASTGNPVLELGEGLDYAEGFDVSDQTSVTPGTVLVIDPDNPGKLVISQTPYDRKVAGIVAGANGLGSGVRLGAGQFDYDVALAGRVYCLVDATELGVEPGDLLTTSATPGHAMKVTDHTRAQGAILGKAMQRLEAGHTGQIMVLVTLQ